MPIEFPCDNNLCRKEMRKFFLQLFRTYFEMRKEGRDRPYNNSLLFVYKCHIICTNVQYTQSYTSHWPEKRDVQKPYMIICYLCVHEMQSLKIIFPDEEKKTTKAHRMNLYADTHSHFIHNALFIYANLLRHV